MTPTSLVMAYYINPGMLRKQFNYIRELPLKLRDLLSVVVVDDGSPHSPAMPEEIGCALQIWRIDTDIRWNQDAARNIGAAHAETNWLFLTDIDHVVPRDTWEKCLLHDWDPEVAYQFRRVSAPDMQAYKQHPNSWFMAKSKFEACGGYDERFAGYYGTDGDFRNRVTESGIVVQMKEAIIRVPRQVIPDASTTTYLRKQPEDTEAIRRIKAERGKEEDQRPKRLTFPYHRVFPLILLALALAGSPALAREGWQERPKVCHDKLEEAELKQCRAWIANVEQPMAGSTSSCCGEGDAFLADAFEVDDEGRYVAIISEDYIGGTFDDGEGGTYTNPGFSKGDKVVIPKDKVNPQGGKKGNNPTGHGIVFMDARGAVLCYFSPTLS